MKNGSIFGRDEDSRKISREAAGGRNGSFTIKSLHFNSTLLFALWEFQTVVKRFSAINKTTTKESSNISAEKL
jgi:hypothetical protein